MINKNQLFALQEACQNYDYAIYLKTYMEGHKGSPKFRHALEKANTSELEKAIVILEQNGRKSLNVFFNSLLGDD